MASLSRLGVLLCLGSGAAFAVQPVLGTLALGAGARIESLLGWRYALAALVLAAFARKRLATLGLRTALAAFAIGLVLYSADSFLFYAALQRTSAPFASLLHYAHLAVVVGLAAATGRERLSRRKALALVAILSGVALVGGGGTSFDLTGTALALASAAVYSVSILAADRLLRDADPIATSTALTAGTAAAFLSLAGVGGTLFEFGGPTGIAVAIAAALVGSVFALTAFVSSIRLLGPATASLLVTVEVPIGLALAAVVLGEGLAPAQLAGAAAVVAAIVGLQVRLPRLWLSYLRAPRLRLVRLVFSLLP